MQQITEPVMSSFITSDSGGKVWKTSESHPLLKNTDTTHPAFLDKLAEVYSRGGVRGLPRICSENSEDARTWHYFSRLLLDIAERNQILTGLFLQAFPESFSVPRSDDVSITDLEFWPKLEPPASRAQHFREGPSEPDLLFRMADSAVVVVEAKYRSDVSERTTYDETRDQVIRLIDVGSWHAKQNGYESSYVIVLQYGNAKTNAEEITRLYAGNPEAIQRALPYRTDLTDADYRRLACSVAFVRWPDPMEEVI